MIKRKRDGTFDKGTQAGKQFKPEGLPWNKGVKGIRLCPETEFKLGEKVGEEHPSWKGGVQVNKNDAVYLWNGCNSRIRRPRKVYEDSYGPIPTGYVIYHRDGNKLNDSPVNLEAISRAELVKRNRESSKLR